MIKTPNPSSDKNLILTQATLPQPPVPKSYEDCLLDVTYFKYERQRFLSDLDSLHCLRTAEYLCKFVALDRKLQKLKLYHEIAGRLQQGL